MSEREIRAGDEVFRGTLLRQGIGADFDDWFEEGLGRFSMPRPGVMEVDAVEGGYTAFLRTELPDDLLVRYRCTTLPPQGQNNINIISHCQPPERGEWPIVEAGRYKGYREMPNYIVTFVGGYNEFEGVRECDGRQRLRRNPGFALIDEKEVYPSDLERPYEITFTVLGGRVRYYIDGQKVFDWQDPEPITGGGFFAFRTYKTHEVYEDLVILELARD
jgi:hypothetical protein